MSKFKLSNKQILAFFPVKECIKEWELIIADRKKLVETMKELIKNKIKRPFPKWFWEQVVYYIWGEASPLWKEVIKKIIKAKILLNSLSSQPLTNLSITHLQIEQAKLVPIQHLLPVRVHKLGNRYKCECVFHNETIPSFVINTDNTYHCFGCGRHGDSISFIMELKNLSFKESVKYLGELT